MSTIKRRILSVKINLVPDLLLLSGRPENDPSRNEGANAISSGDFYQRIIRNKSGRVGIYQLLSKPSKWCWREQFLKRLSRGGRDLRQYGFGNDYQSQQEYRMFWYLDQILLASWRNRSDAKQFKAWWTYISLKIIRGKR